jgi:hypothetical protein
MAYFSNIGKKYFKKKIMGNVTTSKANNINSPDGNSLAVFVDGNDDIMKVKDVRGNVQELSDYIVIPTPPTIEYIYMYAQSRQNQVFDAINNIVLSFDNVPIKNGIAISDANRKITVSEAGIYNFNLSLQLINKDSSSRQVNIWMQDFETNLSSSNKIYKLNADDFILFNYNITLELDGTEQLYFYGFTNSSNVQLSITAGTSGRPDSPSATLTINKIG